MESYKIGTQFRKKGRHNKDRIYTVVDELTTTNNAGVIVDVVFECEHTYLKHQCKTVESLNTIKIGLIKGGGLAENNHTKCSNHTVQQKTRSRSGQAY